MLIENWSVNGHFSIDEKSSGPAIDILWDIFDISSFITLIIDRTLFAICLCHRNVLPKKLTYLIVSNAWKFPEKKNKVNNREMMARLFCLPGITIN